VQEAYPAAAETTSKRPSLKEGLPEEAQVLKILRRALELGAGLECD
jgi:hypothetical protein